MKQHDKNHQNASVDEPGRKGDWIQNRMVKYHVELVSRRAVQVQIVLPRESEGMPQALVVFTGGQHNR